MWVRVQAFLDRLTALQASTKAGSVIIIMMVIFMLAISTWHPATTEVPVKPTPPITVTPKPDPVTQPPVIEVPDEPVPPIVEPEPDRKEPLPPQPGKKPVAKPEPKPKPKPKPVVKPSAKPKPGSRVCDSNGWCWSY